MFGSKKRKQIEKRILDLTNGENFGICSPPMNAQVALDELARYFLGDDWYSLISMSKEQINTQIVYEIETRYKGAKK